MPDGDTHTNMITERLRIMLASDDRDRGEFLKCGTDPIGTGQILGEHRSDIDRHTRQPPKRSRITRPPPDYACASISQKNTHPGVREVLGEPVQDRLGSI